MFMVLRYRSGTGFIVDRACHTSNFSAVVCGSGVNSGSPLFQTQIDASAKLWFLARTNAGSISDFGGAGFNTNYTMLNGKSYVITIERKYGKSFTIYINGTSSLGGVSTKSDDPNSPVSNTNASGPITLDPIKFGRHNENVAETLDMDVSESIFFNAKFTKQDREAVEDYLGKKYAISITH